MSDTSQHQNGLVNGNTLKVTTSVVFLRALLEAGVTTLFVNLGSDHPAILEAFADSVRLGLKDLNVITCPNEMVALSAAQGYAQVCGKPAAVCVHVDVGTQALSCGVHNVDRCRVPVLIFAGASPFSVHGELPGSRNEFILFLQDVANQPGIVRDYMRYTAEIYSGKTVRSNVMRALQVCTAEPKGPAYLWARREVMEEGVGDSGPKSLIKSPGAWATTAARALSPNAVETIIEALGSAKNPIVITSYLGRRPQAVAPFTQLVELLGLPVLLSAPSAVNIPPNHPQLVDLSYGFGVNQLLRTADVVLIIDSDIPWMPMHNSPPPDSRVFHLDVDPVKCGISCYDYGAELLGAVEAEVAISQLLAAAKQRGLTASQFDARRDRAVAARGERVKRISTDAKRLSRNGPIEVRNFLHRARAVLPRKTLFMNEGISNYGPAWEHLEPEVNSMHTSGACGLGWALGAAIGGSLAASEHQYGYDLIACVLGDGSYLFSIPSSAYWIARRYDTPFLTIVLNNGGWASPRLSALAVHPTGFASRAPANNIHVAFGPDPFTPQYAEIAKAAGGAWARQIRKESEIDEAIAEAIRVVREEKRCAVLDVVVRHFAAAPDVEAGLDAQGS